MSQVGIAGIDVGAGGIRAQVDVNGTLEGVEDPGPTPRTNGKVDLERLAARVEATLLHASPDAEFRAVALGMAGLPGLVDDPGELWRRMRRQRPSLESLVVAGDAVTTHVGALGFQPGIVIAAGTGVITLGTDFADVWNQSDGWGYLLGDHGGGAWIGSQALQAALRANDGRPGGSPLLLEQLVAQFGDPADLISVVYKSDSPGHELASFAPAVADAAHAGDSVACEIWRDAGRELGNTAVAAARGLQPDFSWGGRLFSPGSLLMESFVATIRAAIPEARLAPPKGTSAEGALLLARAAADGQVQPHHPYVYAFQT